MNILEELQDQFLNNEVWTLTFGAGFQRAKVYNNAINETNKSQFKRKLREFIENQILPDYTSKNVSDKQHIKNIYKISDKSNEFSEILNAGRLNFGVSQKLLNLYLKYLWCLKIIPEPPHFPVDRRIQENIKMKPVISWTQMTEHTEYMRIINFVRNIPNRENSISQYELIHFERRN